MATDRWINFGKSRPKKKEAESAVRNFFGGAAESIEWNQDRLIVKLHGAPSEPYEELAPDMVLSPRMRGEDRWIEVVWTRGQIDVITRLGDEYVSSCAAGLARFFARYWEGTIDAEDEDEEE